MSLCALATLCLQHSITYMNMWSPERCCVKMGLPNQRLPATDLALGTPIPGTPYIQGILEHDTKQSSIYSVTGQCFRPHCSPLSSLAKLVLTPYIKVMEQEFFVKDL